MNILFLCNKSPYPPHEGSPLAMNANIKALLNAGHRVKVLALNTNKYYIDENDIPDGYRSSTQIEFVYVDLSIKPLDALLNLFSSDPYHVERFISRDVEDKLITILKKDKFDIVQLEMLHMTPYLETIRKYSSARVVLRSHNIEHLIWQRIANNTKNPFKRIYLKYLTKKLKRYELDHLNHYDGIVTISRIDADYFLENGCKIPITDVAFGLDIGEYLKTGTDYEFPSLFHIGSMNWMPNEEGIRWFLDHTWPLIHKEFPEVKFYLAGRMMPDWLNNLEMKNVEVLGEVPDALVFMRSKAVMIVPLFSGSGIRIKIIEGMALGKTIIASSIGAEGINYSDGKNILIADSPGAFLEAVSRCFADKSFCNQLGDNARDLIKSEYSLELVSKKLEKFYNRILEKN